jgi:hypothetical protein
MEITFRRGTRMIEEKMLLPQRNPFNINEELTYLFSTKSKRTPASSNDMKC